MCGSKSSLLFNQLHLLYFPSTAHKHLIYLVFFVPCVLHDRPAKKRTILLPYTLTVPLSYCSRLELALKKSCFIWRSHSCFQVHQLPNLICFPAAVLDSNPTIFDNLRIDRGLDSGFNTTLQRKYEERFKQEESNFFWRNASLTKKRCSSKILPTLSMFHYKPALLVSSTGVMTKHRFDLPQNDCGTQQLRTSSLTSTESEKK